MVDSWYFANVASSSWLVTLCRKVSSGVEQGDPEGQYYASKPLVSGKERLQVVVCTPGYS